MLIETCIGKGNALHDGKDHRSWFVGDFKKWSLSDSYGLRQDDVVEVKFAQHKEGDEKCNFESSVDCTTMCILIRGTVLVRFRDGCAQTEQTLSAEGDYLIWTRGVQHCWKMLSDSLVITIRWKK